MSRQFLFRQITRNIPEDTFWVGFVARFMHTVDGRSVTGFQALEVASLGLALSEENRSKSGFHFPVDFYLAHRLGKQLVARLCVGIEDPALVFPDIAFLESIDLVFAANGGATLSTLDGACSVTVYDRSHPDGAGMDIFPAHAGKKALRLPLIVAKEGRRSFAPVGGLIAIDDYPGDMAGYLEQLTQGLKPAKPKPPEVAPPAPPQPARVEPPNKVDPLPVPAGSQPVDIAKRQSPPETQPVKDATEQVASKAAAKALEEKVAADLAAKREKAARDKGATARDAAKAAEILAQRLAEEERLKAAAIKEAEEKAAAEKAAKAKAARRMRNMAFIAVLAVAGGWFALSSRTDSIVTAIPAPIPAVPGNGPGKTQQVNAADKLPGAAEPGAAVAQGPIVVPPIPHSGQIISHEQLAAMAYPEHLAKVRSALAAAKAKDSAGIEQVRDWLRANKQVSFLPANEQDAQKVREARRYFNEAIEKKIIRGQQNKDKKEFQQAIVHLNDFLLENFGSANAHLNLAVAYIESDQLKFAVTPAFHTIVFNPDGANGWLQLGLVLAISGEVENGAAAMCVTLHIAKYSEKTLAMFSRMEQGLVYAKPNVKEALAMTRSMCPGAGWL